MSPAAQLVVNEAPLRIGNVELLFSTWSGATGVSNTLLPNQMVNHLNTLKYECACQELGNCRTHLSQEGTLTEACQGWVAL